MITEKEIMVGNLFIGYDDKVFTWSLEHFQILWCDVPIDELIKSPIPITEDWLVKFGFEKISENSAGKRYGYVINDIFSSDLTFIFWKTTNQAGKFFRHGLEIKYVHQLQNLYFALTQTELELK